MNNRPGISPLKAKSSSAIASRIERIGRLNDEHRRCVEEKNRFGLLVLAERYETECKYMHKTARAIRLQAAEMEGTK